MVSSSNFVAIKNDVNIDPNEEYDETIFDDLITDFMTNTEKSTPQTSKIYELPPDSTEHTVWPTHTTPSTSSSSFSDPYFADNILTPNDVDEPVPPIDINDTTQLHLTLVESTCTSSTAPIDNASSPIPHATDSSSKVAHIPVGSFYVENSVLIGRKSNKDQKKTLIMKYLNTC